MHENGKAPGTGPRGSTEPSTSRPTKRPPERNRETPLDDGADQAPETAEQRLTKAGWVPLAWVRADIHEAGFRVGVLLASYADAQTGLCFPHIETLAGVLGVSERTVQAGLAQLIDAGLVERFWGRRGHMFRVLRKPRTMRARTRPVTAPRDADGRYTLRGSRTPDAREVRTPNLRGSRTPTRGVPAPITNQGTNQGDKPVGQTTLLVADGIGDELIECDGCAFMVTPGRSICPLRGPRPAGCLVTEAGAA